MFLTSLLAVFQATHSQPLTKLWVFHQEGLRQQTLSPHPTGAPPCGKQLACPQGGASDAGNTPQKARMPASLQLPVDCVQWQEDKENRIVQR
jgi:hypothetical protein